MSRYITNALYNDPAQPNITQLIETNDLAWEILQYALWLDYDFIPMGLLIRATLSNKYELEDAINVLENFSLAMVVNKPDSKGIVHIGMGLDKEVQARCFEYITKYRSRSELQFVAARLLEICNELLPAVAPVSDDSWYWAGRYSSNVAALLKFIDTREIGANKAVAQLHSKLGAIYSIALVNLNEAAYHYSKASSYFIALDSLSDAASNLRKLAAAHDSLGNYRNSEKYYELALRYEAKPYITFNEIALKEYEELSDMKHSNAALNFFFLGLTYEGFGDSKKAINYFKHSYSICDNIKLCSEDIVSNIKDNIVRLEPGYNVASLATRKPILKLNNLGLFDIKIDLQKGFLNNIQNLVSSGSSADEQDKEIMNSLAEPEIIKHLKEHEIEPNDKNIKAVLMLAFEAINLSIINSNLDRCSSVRKFAEAHQDLLNKIDAEYPEFFVDSYIKNECLGALHDEL
jgi:tetratricopeptide (TPR) repeat protein